MKTVLFVAAMVLASVPAFADQSFSCVQVSKDGKKLKKPGTLDVVLKTNTNGEVNEKLSTVVVNGFGGENDFIGTNLVVRSVDNNLEHSFTNIFMLPQADLDDGMLDLQLQFDSAFLGKKLDNVAATYVIASDDANPDTSFAFGYKLVCNSK